MLKRPNYLTVQAALIELEKIVMIRQLDGGFRLDHAVYDTQFLGYPSGQKKLNR